MRCAVLDLGSTSFQLLVTDATPEGVLTHVLRARVILNLGAEVASTGRVPDDLLDRALHTVARFRDIADRAGAEAIWPVATSAFRDAANQPWLSKALRGALGVPVRILGGDEEARSTVSGIRASVALPPGPWLAFDLGGGSLEIAHVEDEQIRWTDSYPLGAARLARTMVGHDPMTRSERRELRRLVKERARARRRGLRSAGRARCASSPAAPPGRSPGLLAARRWPAPPTSLNQYEVQVEALSELSRTLCSSSLQERLSWPGIDERRADLLPAGSVVLATALELFGADSAVHSEWGLREGVVLRELGAAIPASPADLRRGAVDRLAHDVEHRRRPLRRGPPTRGPALRRDARAPRSRARWSASCWGRRRASTTSARGSRPTSTTSTAPTSWSTRACAGSRPTRWP